MAPDYGIVEAILWLIVLAVVAVGLLFVGAGAALSANKWRGAAAGATVFAALLGLGIAFLGIEVLEHGRVDAERRRAYEKIERAFAEGCFRASRTFARSARGDELIYIRLRGVEAVPERQRYVLLPSKDLPEGIALGSPPEDGPPAITVDIVYSRQLIEGSLENYAWHRTQFELTARTHPDGALIASALDMEARNGFCFGDLETFLRRALNRPAVLRADPPGSVWKRRAEPDTYLQARYTDHTRGTFAAPQRITDNFPAAKSLLLSRTCRVIESTISDPVAICATGEAQPVEVPLKALLGLIEAGESWFFVYRNHQGINSLTSLRVEQRLSNWNLSRVWHAQLVPPPGQGRGQEYVGNFDVSGDVLTAFAYWDFQNDASGRSWFAERAMLTVPLPGRTP